MSTARHFGVIAAALGVAAALAGDPPQTISARIDIDDLAGIVAREEDHVTALELAAWLRARKPGLRVVDVRSVAEFEAYSLPGAEHVPIARIAHAMYTDRETVVLVSDGGAHAAQAWVFLRAMGLHDVYFLRGGVQEWIEEVMAPTLAADASPQQRREFETRAELSRYFDGMPQVGGTPSRGSDDVRIKRVPRRGC